MNDMQSRVLAQIVLEGARAMGVPMTQAQADQFGRYHDLLTRANARMNLTAVPEDLREAADRNYLDCIVPLQAGLPPAEWAVDVGSGAGFPGIPLSIMRPDIHFVLMDALGKRVDFLNSVIVELGLNARALHIRAEDAARREALRERFDLAVARAVAPMNVLCEYLLPMVRVGGCALALKGPGLEEELRAAQFAIGELGGRVEAAARLDIPGRDWDHRAVILRKQAPTPQRYPRRAGLPEKRPLTAPVEKGAGNRDVQA